VAELTSAFLCAHLGISPTPRPDHAQYLNHWVQKLSDDARAFLAAASAAQKAADYLRGLQPAQEDIDQAA
jgi:antirestriction protein ArdC